MTGLFQVIYVAIQVLDKDDVDPQYMEKLAKIVASEIISTKFAWLIEFPLLHFSGRLPPSRRNITISEGKRQFRISKPENKAARKELEASDDIPMDIVELLAQNQQERAVENSREETGELCVGVRRHARQQCSMPSSVISSQSMHLGVLGTASHTVLTQSFFVVYYKPRFSSTIVGVEDISPQWDNSKWRTLKVILLCCLFLISNIVEPMASTASPTWNLTHDAHKKNQAFERQRLFGFDLKSPSTVSLKPVDISNDGVELYTSSMLSSGDLERISCVTKDFRDPKQDHLQVVTKEVQSRQINSSRSCTKVQMQGIVVGRAVDLTTLKGYDDLITELEEMFEIKEELQSRNKWEIVFTDDEGDMMLVGDDPWIVFTPYYSETVLYINPELWVENEDGISILFYLQKIFPVGFGCLLDVSFSPCLPLMIPFSSNLLLLFRSLRNFNVIDD
ncbi:hypothetical protein ACS0TY_005697 [Phlomoides rotata]